MGLTVDAICACGCGTPIQTTNRWGRKNIRFVRGHNRRGHKLSDQARQALSEVVAGAQHPQWKGDAASYSAVHRWRSRNCLKSGVCDQCGVTGKRTDWANVSGEYRREDESDWLELCRSCHYRRDRANPKRKVAA